MKRHLIGKTKHNGARDSFVENGVFYARKEMANIAIAATAKSIRQCVTINLTVPFIYTLLSQL